MSAAGARKVEEYMEVVCSRGMHVGTVDRVDGSQLKLTKGDSDDGMHHLIPSSLVASVDAKVHLSKTCDEVKASWKSA